MWGRLPGSTQGAGEGASQGGPHLGCPAPRPTPRPLPQSCSPPRHLRAPWNRVEEQAGVNSGRASRGRGGGHQGACHWLMRQFQAPTLHYSWAAERGSPGGRGGIGEEEAELGGGGEGVPAEEAWEDGRRHEEGAPLSESLIRGRQPLQGADTASRPGSAGHTRERQRGHSAPGRLLSLEQPPSAQPRHTRLGRQERE